MAYRYIYSLILSGLLTLSTACHDDPEPSCEGTLESKPLEQIKICIYGKWRLVEAFNYLGNFPITNLGIEFTATDLIYWIENNQIILESLVEWKYSTVHNTYLMNSEVMNLAVIEIKNDTLVLDGLNLDGASYKLIPDF